jgi:DNA-binding transcriptional MerR regulator
MTEVSYSFRDLVAAAAAAERLTLDERTARHYVAEGLLPTPPRGRGATVTYTDEHLAQLRMVLRLVNQYVPQAEIRRWLPTLSAAQLQALLDRPALPRLPVEGDAQAYLSRLRKTVAVSAPQRATPHEAPIPLSIAPATRSRRASTSPPAPTTPAYERGMWLRIAVDPDVELLIRTRGFGPPAEMVDRVVAAVQAALVAEGRQGD